MNFRILLVAVCGSLVVACTTYSGPTHNTDIVTLANGAQAYRVQCQGIFESSNACLAQVQKICGDKPAVRVSSTDRVASGFKPENDPREMMFMCGAPAAQRVEPQPAPQPAPSAARPAPVPNPARKVTLQGDANFATGSAALTPAATTSLDRFIDANRGIRIDRLTIAGYTDSTGSATLNEHLSTARAQAVQSYLASHGVRATSADVNGFGSASPVASNATAEGRAKNRRVDIQVDGQ